MNTSNYVLELLIAGISTFIWIILLCISCWGNDLAINMSAFQNSDKFLLGLAFAPIIYVVGIINDRLVDSLFDRVSPVRKKYFPEIKQYREARSAVYINSVTLTKLFEYGRMRIRICRNWTANGILILISFLVFIWSDPANYIIQNSEAKIEISIAFSAIMLLSIIGAYTSWKDLNVKEFEFLKIQGEIFAQKVPASDSADDTHTV